MKTIISCSLALGLFCGVSAFAGSPQCGSSTSKHCAMSGAGCASEKCDSPLAHQDSRADMLRLRSSCSSPDACPHKDKKSCDEECDLDKKSCDASKQRESRRSARDAARKDSQMTVIYSSRGGAAYSTTVEVRR